jgi:hypothetical protein
MIKASWNVSLSPGNEQQFYYGSEVGKKKKEAETMLVLTVRLLIF